MAWIKKLTHHSRNSSATREAPATPPPEATRSSSTARASSAFSVGTVRKLFTYKPLSSESYEIRILNLLPRSGCLTGIHCKIEHTTLLSPGPYTALSYCWGDTSPSDNLPIRIDDCTVPVTPNLRAALEQLWRRGHTRVWIDALCINQNDREERSLQVRHMRLVYAKAKEVVAYIGSPTIPIQTPTGTQQIEAEDDAVVVKALLENDYLTLFQDKSRSQSWYEGSLLASFFGQAYFQRVWIIQELCVASKITLLYGSTSISWDKLARTFISLLDLQNLTPGLRKTMPIDVGDYSYLLTLVDFRHRTNTLRMEVELLEAIRQTHKSKATEERDRVFALLGVASDGPALVPLPNYRQSFEEILQDLSVNLMVKDKSLDLMVVKEVCPTPKERRPSWVFDVLGVWEKELSFLSKGILEERRNYTSLPFMERLEGGVLMVKGKMLDTVNSMSSVATDLMGGWEVHDQFRAPRSRLYGGDLGVLDAVWKSLMLGAFPGDEAGRPDASNLDIWRTCFRNVINYAETPMDLERALLRDWLLKNSKFKLGSQTLRDLSHVKEQPTTWSGTIGQLFRATSAPTVEQRMYFIDSIAKVIEGSMRLVMTFDGYIGLVHPNTRLGDEICCISGCSVPVVLRQNIPQRGHKVTTYKVIGPAYVHGISDRQGQGVARVGGSDLDLMTRNGMAVGNEIRAPHERSEMFKEYRNVLLY
jgi:hypothetical protein